MKKLTASIMLFVMLLTAPFRAEANPGVIVVGTVAMGAALLTVSGVTYYKPLEGSFSGPSHVASVLGATGRILYTTWQDYSAYSTQIIKNKLITAKIVFSDLLSMVKNNASTYPNLYDALTDINSKTVDTSSYDAISVGDVISTPFGYRTVTGKDYGSTATMLNYCSPNDGNSNPCWRTSNVHVGYGASCGDFCFYQTVTISFGSTNVVPTTVDASASDYRSRLNASLGIYSGEIDALISSNPNIVHFTDTATPDTDLDTAPPFVLPVTPPVPQTVSNLGAETKTAVDSRLAAAKAAQAAAATALAADPTNQALIDAKAAADAELAAAQKATDAATQATGEKYISPESPILKQLNFDKWRQFLNLLTTLWPFTLIVSFSGYVSAFVREPHAPEFDLPIYGGTGLHISLSMFDIVAQLCRWVIATLFTLGIVQRIISWYKGES